MKGDFSRLTFAKSKRYRRVLMQQGRVEIDADGNEQIAIDAHLAATTAYDVIGQSGYPLALLPDGTPAGGFAIALTPNGDDLTISKGRMYVDGRLIENDEPNATLLHQPDVPFAANTTVADLTLKPKGVYVVYLDVWERLITALDDPSIRETALGGPDTSVRTKLVWQVKLGWAQELGNVPPTCASVGNGWKPVNLKRGRIAAQSGAPDVAQLPCILPPETGYRRLENQLYRVEIHTAGTYGTATFKWSRENGSVVAHVIAPGVPNPPPSVTGPLFSVASTGRDLSLGFKAGDWVELTDDRTELFGRAGELLQVKAVSSAGTIETFAAAAAPVDLALHPKLRRWDQTGTGLGQGVKIVDGNFVELEDGVEVQFTNGNFDVGDYWVIPARTKTSVESGSVEWPLDANGYPELQLPRGIEHHYAKLALVVFDGKTFQNIDGAVPDCRLSFPPLTDREPPEPPGCPCTITAVPGPGWEKPILALFTDPAAVVDAEICFPVGTFALTAAKGPLRIATRGNIKVIGAGWGTKLVGEGMESVLRFEGCASVDVSDLSAATTAVDAPPDPGKRHINGTLEFRDCAEVTVDGVRLACGSGKARGAACVSVYQTTTDANAATGVGSVRIRASRMEVGALQVGILVVHAERTTIEDNEVVADLSALGPSLSAMVHDPYYLAAARGLLMARGTVTQTSAPSVRAAAVPAGDGGETTTALQVGNQTLSFGGPAALAQTWQTFLNEHAPKALATPRDARNFVKSSATKILTDPALRVNFSQFANVVHVLQHQDRAVAARGIVVAGRGGVDVRIRNNTVSGVLQGITAGVSHRAAPADRPDTLRTVTISGNTVDLYLNVFARKSIRCGILVGNVDSLLVDNNRTMLTAGVGAAGLQSDGVRVYGYLGKKIVARHNHVTGFVTGIRVVGLRGPNQPVVLPPPPKPPAPPPYTAPLRSGNLWLVADNALTARVPIDAAACVLVDNVS